MDLIAVRLVFILFVAVTCYLIPPFGLGPKLDAGVGALLGLAIVIFEWRLESVSLKRLIGAAIGSVLGIFGAYLFAVVIRNSISPGPTQSFLQIMVMFLMAYVGLIVGANKGDLLNLSALGGIFGGEKQSRKSYKILDTSVIIDGRIADIAETLSLIHIWLVNRNAPPPRLLLLFLVVQSLRINISEPRFYGQHYTSQTNGSRS